MGLERMTPPDGVPGPKCVRQTRPGLPPRFHDQSASFDTKAELCVDRGLPCHLRIATAKLFEEFDMTKTVLATMLLAATLLTAACNTIQGAGRDVASVGKAVDRAAD